MKFLKWSTLLFVFTYPFLTVNGQYSATPVQAFKLQKVSGDIKLDGFYNYKTLNNNGIEDKYNISYISPAISLKTKSYIGHPDFLSIKINADYNPELRTSIADIHPDQVDKISYRGIDISANLLKRKEIRLNSNFKISDGYYNTEDISYTKFKNKYWDIQLSSVKNEIPFQITYSNIISKNKNLTINQSNSFDTKRLLGNIKNSFFKNNLNELMYTYINDNRLYNNLNGVNTESHDINLNNRFAFDRQNNYSLNSMVRNNIRYGNLESKEFSAIEKLLFKFPANFKLGLNYQYKDYTRQKLNINQNNIYSHLDHQLFRSLRSSVFTSINNTKSGLYNSKIIQTGFSFNYMKTIPTGSININYHYADELMDSKNEPSTIQIVNEQHTISDGDLLVLNNQFVIKESVIVKNMNQILIYQENFDYYLIDQGNYVEIQRIPGGQMDNNSIIYVDYLTELSGTSSYSLNRHNFSAKVSVFKQLLSIYYNYREDAYSDIHFINTFSRDQYKQHVWGIKSRSKYHGAGIEYKEKESSLLPIQQLKYYANLRLSFKKFYFFASANQIHYYKYGNSINQNYFYSSVKTTYNMNSFTKIVYSFNFKKQTLNNTPLDLIKSKLEYSSKIRKFRYSFGLEYFHKNILLDKTQLGGVFVRIMRKF